MKENKTIVKRTLKGQNKILLSNEKLIILLRFEPHYFTLQMNALTHILQTLKTNY